MKINFKIRFAAVAALISFAPAWLSAEELVIMHTNDTHSQIDPTDKGLGGIQRRKALIDSIRAVHPDALLIDAGDAVQGSLYFTIYGGEVEMKLMDELGYDYAIVGNHDFDNGADALAKNLANSHVQWLSTNYDLKGSPIEKSFKPYAIREVGGKKVGIIALNLNPEGMIADGNYDGVRYLDAIKAANATAWHLKHNEKVDLVVAVTHLGYDGTEPSDREVAAASEDIDIILGGHTHTSIKPGSGQEWVTNAVGRKVLVTQNAKSGASVAEVTVDLDSLGVKLPQYKQITVDSRLDGKRDARIDSLLAPYRGGVDEMMARRIGRSKAEMPSNEPALLNFVTDFILSEGEKLSGGKVDLAIGNKGSLRRSLPKGDITEGQIIMMQPFDNRIVVEDINGADLLEAFEVMAKRNGDGVSRGTEVVFDPQTHKCISATVNGKPVDPNATYRMATIDYLANGGDYMKPLTRGRRVATSDRIVYLDLIDHIKRVKTIRPDNASRMHP